MLDDARQHYEEHFKKIVQRTKDLGVDLETDIAVGHPVEQIVHRAEVDHVDLIVLGRRGKSRFEKMLVGSTAEKVLRYAHCNGDGCEMTEDKPIAPHREVLLNESGKTATCHLRVRRQTAKRGRGNLPRNCIETCISSLCPGCRAGTAEDDRGLHCSPSGATRPCLAWPGDSGRKTLYSSLACDPRSTGHSRHRGRRMKPRHMCGFGNQQFKGAE